MNGIDMRTVGIAVAAAGAASALWFLLAWRSPTSTFHFAPFIAAGVGPYAARATSGPRAANAAASIAAISTMVVALTIILLAAADRLRGPTFWSEDGAITETVLFAAIGAVVGTGLLAAPAARPAD